MTDETTGPVEGLQEAAVAVGDQLIHDTSRLWRMRRRLLCLGAAAAVPASVLLLRHKRTVRH